MGTRNNGKAIDILLAEDNPGDIMLTNKAFEEGKIANKLHTVQSGVEALQFLRREGDFASAPRPDLILLDIRMPGKDGMEVLDEIKKDSELKCIPVVMLTSSEAEEDILKSYELSANAYLSKPVDFDGFVKIVNTLEDFWFSVVKLPPS
ncbi:MAG: response regulator [Chloroflexota bacterium]